MITPLVIYSIDTYSRLFAYSFLIRFKAQITSLGPKSSDSLKFFLLKIIFRLPNV